MENGQKLDNIQDTVTELRVSMATMTGKLDAVLSRLDVHDAVSADVERRLRALERRLYGIPGVAALLGIAGFGLALWVAFRK